MLELIQVKFQEQVVGSRKQNFPSLTDQEESSTDRIAFPQILISAHQPIKPIKWLGFQIYFTEYLEEILRHVLKRLGSFSFEI